MIYWYSTSRYDEWDNRFFGISDKEAESVDPQQHFVLESVHMALEDAGIPKEKIAGSGTGVYIGLYLISWINTCFKGDRDTSILWCTSDRNKTIKSSIIS